ncbi:hypothetical protein A3Q56_01237 [Intoshia linei]|uniref:Tc1-like transposase DDE domain-containing protein n=1 Tax=Intoshia linei TaxID=1819745 RepID=A0A177BA13_9BILA|nr:hypothetical protein A3Q56_01237 [Intoshia linei]
MGLPLKSVNPMKNSKVARSNVILDNKIWHNRNLTKSNLRNTVIVRYLAQSLRNDTTDIFMENFSAVSKLHDLMSIQRSEIVSLNFWGGQKKSQATMQCLTSCTSDYLHYLYQLSLQKIPFSPDKRGQYSGGICSNAVPPEEVPAYTIGRASQLHGDIGTSLAYTTLKSRQFNGILSTVHTADNLGIPLKTAENSRGLQQSGVQNMNIFSFCVENIEFLVPIGRSLTTDIFITEIKQCVYYKWRNGRVVEIYITPKQYSTRPFRNNIQFKPPFEIPSTLFQFLNPIENVFIVWKNSVKRACVQTNEIRSNCSEGQEYMRQPLYDYLTDKWWSVRKRPVALEGRYPYVGLVVDSTSVYRSSGIEIHSKRLWDGKNDVRLATICTRGKDIITLNLWIQYMSMYSDGEYPRIIAMMYTKSMKPENESRSKIGCRSNIITASSKGSNLHCISAMTSNRMLLFQNRRGSYSGDDCQHWFRGLINCCLQLSISSPTFVIDNAPIHSRLETVISADGVELLKLAPLLVSAQSNRIGMEFHSPLFQRCAYFRKNSSLRNILSSDDSPCS